MKKSNLVICILAVLTFLIFKSNFIVQAAANNGDNLSVKYRTHVQNVGWQQYVLDGQMSGTSGQALRLEGINISLDNPIPGMKIKYQTHVQYDGWQDWKYDGDMSGTSGRSLRLEGIKIQLEGAPAGYHVQYQVHVQNIGWQNWVQDGQMAGTEGQALRLEGIRIRVVKEGTSLFGGLGVAYQTHVQYLGWQDNVYDGQMSGTSGQALRLEGIKIALQNAPAGMRIKYQTHVQNVGWQNSVYDGTMSGTNGQSLRLEGIRIQLEGAPVGYHIQYQVHVQNVGWQDWVYDGDTAGTVGQGLRLEGIRIRIINIGNENKFITGTINYNITFNDMLDYQFGKTPVYDGGFSGWVTADKSRIQYYLDINNFSSNQQNLQFMKLDSYIEGITDQELSTYLADKGVFDGKAAVFIEAAKTNNINLIYLVSHALWETGKGTSSLARGAMVTQINGKSVDPKVAYNMFGIGATDGNAYYGGSAAVYLRGWFTVDDAIKGGAKWIADNYIHSSTYNQDTLYKMRWNYGPNGWHQYATDINWANGITIFENEVIRYFKGKIFNIEVPAYKQ